MSRFNSLIKVAAAGFLVLMLTLSASILKVDAPVKWEFKYEQKGAVINLILTASISDGWHIYSLSETDQGPIPTSIIIENSKQFQVAGKMETPKPLTEYDPNFDMNLEFYENQVSFIQKIKPTTKEKFTVKGTVTFMACDNQKCLPPSDVPFSLDIIPNE